MTLFQNRKSTTIAKVSSIQSATAEFIHQCMKGIAINE